MPPTASQAQAWAELGMAELWDDLQGEKFPMTLEQASVWIRAAYGRGYCNALSEPVPSIYTDVFERSAILQVLVPVR